VLRGFGLWPYARRCRRLGFHAFYPGELLNKKYKHLKITNEMVDAAWADLLKDPPAEWRIPYRHRTELDRKFAALHFNIESRFSFWLWLRNQLRSLVHN
jgi:hypothetical protein